VKNITAPTCDDRLLWETWMTTFHFPSLVAADELGLFSLLNQSPLTAQDIAASLSLSARATEALLGIMTSLGYLGKLNDKFYLTDVARNFLLKDSLYYWGGLLRMMRNQPVTSSGIIEALRNDLPVFYKNQDIWETHQIDSEQAAVFTAAMHSNTVSPAIGAAWYGDFVNVKRLLDVGGGSGAFSLALARQYPDMYCTILELPVVAKITEEYIAEAGLQGQVDTLCGDFFTDPLPRGYDAFLFSNIFHDWRTEQCLQLAQKSFEALPAGGRIYIHEILLSDPKDGPVVATSLSMCMIWATQGQQFTAGELNQLLTKCGFEDISITKTYGYYALISAKKP
jgi:predicted O-methyltransferase YrrM